MYFICHISVIKGSFKQIFREKKNNLLAKREKRFYTKPEFKNGGMMIQEALFITIVGMGGVFTFLLILIAGMVSLSGVVAETERKQTDKIALAIAVARAQGK